MKMPNIGGLLSVGKTVLAAHRPEILFGASVVATIGSTVLAAKGGWDARGIVDQENADRQSGTTINEHVAEPLTKREIANLTWHCYTPAALTCLSAVGATTGLHIVHMSEKKAMAAAGLAAIDEIKREAKEFERENLGVVSKEERDKVLEERQKNTPIGADKSSHIQYGDGEIEPMYLIRDHKTGRDIYSNQRRMEEAIIGVNQILSANEAVELAQFYQNAGFAETEDSYEVGWNAGELVELKWDITVRDDGQAVRIVNFRPAPSEGFRRTH